MELFDLDRFIQAQENDNFYETALQEVKESYKRTHWIWYIFPQIDGLGHSSTSKRYGIKSLLEAKAYLENDYLRNHLNEITKALIDQDESLLDVLGRIDAIKVCSCMTLFNLVSHDDVFARVLEKYNEGMECEGTLEIVKKELTYYNEDSAFERNGIHTQEKAFFESGSDESNQYSFEQKMATMLDLVSRGETMLAMVQRYFWERDMSHHRVSGVESTIRQYLRSLINELYKALKDKTLTKKVYDFLHAIPFSESNVFTWANAYDEFYKKYHQNNEIKAAFETILKDSLCKPIEKKPVAREYNGVERPEFTPSKLSSLKNDEVFVFGSNLAGRHAGGAARAAVNRFGAIWGQGVGLQGQSYAIPTMQGGVETIKPYVDDFIAFACQHPELFFYVTRIGCGIAGFKDEDIAPLFRKAVRLENVCLPESFFSVIKKNGFTEVFPEISRSAAIRLHQQGQVRTLADITETLNNQHHFTNATEFLETFDSTIHSYIERGTVSHQVCFAIEDMIQKNEKVLFGNHHFLDFDKFIKLVDTLTYNTKDESPLDVIYSRREKTKILRLAKVLNDIMHYTDAMDLLYDLSAIATGRFNCDDNSYMNDSFRYPLYFFRQGLNSLWNKIQKDGYMSNELLEQKMFTDHEQKLNEKGLKRVIEEDYEQDGACHPEVYIPKEIGTAPIYVKDKFFTDHCTGEPLFVKSCGEGKGPNAHRTLYEMSLVERFILRRECDKGEYKEVDDYYVPIHDDTKPIFKKRHGIMEFDLSIDKMHLLHELRNKRSSC